MKKRIFSILLAAIMVFSLLPVTAFAGTCSTIAEVLATTDFPTDEVTAWVCKSDRNKVVYKDGDNSKLTIGSYYEGGFTKDQYFNCPTASKVAWNEDGFYYCEPEGYGTIKFNMESDVLKSITFDNSSFDGTYSPVTIENILPKGFPTSADNAWENSSNDDVCVYKDDSNLTFYNEPVTVLLSSPLTRAEQIPDSDFTCTFEYVGESKFTIQFNMTGDYGNELGNIIVTNCFPDAVNGTYEPHEETDSHTHGEGDDAITFNTAWTDNTSLPSAAGNYYLDTDVTLSSTWNVPTSGITNLCLNGHVIKANTTEDNKFSVITVPQNATLNLYDCGTTEHYFTVGDAGLWTLTGTKTEATKTIKGGVITGGTGYKAHDGYETLYGGGVYVSTSGSFTMTSGNIVGNTANDGGGVSVDGGTFIMKGGSISGNNSSGSAGGVYVGKFDEVNGTFTMNGGSISDNTSQKTGGGVDISYGTFTMNGSSIVSNNTCNEQGAGVYVRNSGTFTMSDNSQISGNTTKSFGGGVSVNSGSFTMSGNSQIMHNNGAIGGVYIISSFEMKDSSSIDHNTGTNVGGVCVMGNGSIILGGMAKISDNTVGDSKACNVYLGNGKTITLGTGENAPVTTDAGNGTMSVGVTMQSGTGVFTGENGKNYSALFTPDAGVDYKVINLTGDGNKLKLVKLGNLEFQISQNDRIGKDGKSIEYENGYKLSVVYEGMGDNVISTVNEHTELRDIPDGTSVTFTLTVPQGETKVPDLMMSGARETFTDNTFTTNLNFSQNTVTIVSLDFGGDPGPSQEDGHIVKIQINNNDGANGTIQYKFDTDEAFTSKTASDKDDSGNIRLEIPEGATKVTFKAVPDDGHALQDCTILYDDKDIDQTKAYMNAVKGDGYEYTLPKDDKTIVFRADFGNQLVEWHSVSWGGGNVTIENGTVEAYAVHVGEKTYDESVKAADETKKLYPLSDITNVDIQKNPVSFGNTDMFISDANNEAVSVDFRFIPDYGYQVTDVKATEDSLLEFFKPGEEISTFHFAYEPKTNVHFIVEFTATEDTIDRKGSEIINGASIGNGGNAIDSGNLKMTISDVDEADVSGGLKDEVGENEALYLDLTLSQVVSKTGENGNWEKPLTDLNDTINVTLNVKDLDPEAQYYIVREHGSSCEMIPVEYNSAEGTVSFDTNKFSTYALVKDVLLPGEFVVEYDNRGSDKAGISVSGGDHGIIGNGEQCSFTSGSAITFTLTPPKDRTDDTPIVEIQIYDGHDDVPDTVWRSDFDSGNVLAIDNNSFTFTPADDSAFIVRIWWSEYDAFGPDENQYMIETNVIGCGSVLYSEDGIGGAVYGSGNPHKDCYNVGTGVVLSFVPDEGHELSVVAAGESVYAAEPDDGASPLSDILDAVSGQYLITITGANEGDYFYVEAVFSELIVPPTPAHHDPDPVINVPLSGDENSIDVKATVSGNTATIQPIKEEEIEKVIGDDAETGTVVIDLSGTNKTITGAKLPTETVQAIAEAAAENGSDTAGLKLELSSGTLEFDAKALEAITEAAGDAKNIEIHFDNVGTTRLNADQKAAVSEMVVIEGFEAYVTVNGTRVSDFNGGSVAVYIPYEIPEGNDPAGYTVWFIAEDGTMEKQNATYDGINHRFVVSHFSDYVLTYDETVGQYDNCPKDDTCPMSKFTDADMKAWYHDGVHYCLDNSIMAGFPGDLFKPNGTTTRAQIAQILYNLEGQPAFMNDNIFSDVASGSWYEKAVVWAQGKGVVSGYPDGTFKPDDSITREQLAVILYNYAKYKEIDVTVDENTNFLSFNDFWDTSEWAKSAMMWAIDRELIVGTNWDLKPQGDAVRVQAATIIWKFCETIAK